MLSHSSQSSSTTKTPKAVTKVRPQEQLPRMSQPEELARPRSVEPVVAPETSAATQRQDRLFAWTEALLIVGLWLALAAGLGSPVALAVATVGLCVMLFGRALLRTVEARRRDSSRHH